MAEKKRHNIAIGVLSVFVLSCGIAFCVLAACVLNSLHDRENGEAIDYVFEVDPERQNRGHHKGDHEGQHTGHHEGQHTGHHEGQHTGHHEGQHTGHHEGQHTGHHDGEQLPTPDESMKSEPVQEDMMDLQSIQDEMPPVYDDDFRIYLWIPGFAFIVTGMLGVISAFVRAKGAYITHMVVGIVTLVLKGTILIYTIYGMKYLKMMDSCSDSSCDKFVIMVKTIGIIVIVIIGWTLTLATTILSGILGCRRKQGNAEITKAHFTAAILQAAPELPTKAGYFPSVNDKASLVGNVEYSK